MPARQTSPIQLQSRRVLPGPGEGLAMGTRAAAFTAKIRNLLDYHLRLLHGIMPVPSGVDIANTLKYFSGTLLTVLKDVPNAPLEMLKSRERDSIRLGLFPNVDYKGLYNAISQLVEVATLIQFGLQAFGSAMLQTLGCLLPFLDHDMIDSMPYLTASAMAVLPVSLHQEIVNYLCYYILPFTVVRRKDEDLENYASQSVAAVIMMVFQYSDNPAHHCQLLECLMTTKKSVVKDLLCVVAYGTAGARASAAKLLFYYWPTFNPNLFDRRVVLQKFTTNLVPFVCQRDMCPNAGNAEAAKVCFDHCISITFASDSPPPLYLCIECANEIHREHPNQVFVDILHPMQQVSMTCENKNCRASDKYAMTICFSIECASYNGNRPIRYCQQCHNIRHNNRRGGDHIFHRSLPQIWDMSPEMQAYLVDAIMSLLKEAKPLSTESSKDVTPELAIKASLLNAPEISDPMTAEERQLLGRYGVWLLVGLCTPNDNTPPEILGRLLAMLFHWFDATSFFEDVQESTIERLKLDFVCEWLAGVCRTHFDVFVSCLVPHPPEYARVGGHWDHLVSRVWHLRHGLHRLLCLVPYEIITSEIWDHVMPHWMEAIVNDVPHRELHELKILLSKILDPDMSPLGFDAKKLYHFVYVRFTKTSAKVQEQALNWLQSLTVLEIVIPLPLMFSMFADGVKMMRGSKEEQEKPLEKTTKTTTKPEEKKSPITPVVEDDSGNTSVLSEDDAPESRSLEFESDAELSLSCCVLMLDVLIKQLELQKVERFIGIHTSLAQDIFKLLQSQIQVSSAWTGQHACEDDECAYCEAGIMWYQLVLELVLYLCPEHPVRPPDLHLDENYDESRRSPAAPECETKKSSSETKPDVVINMPVQDPHGVGSVLANMPHAFGVGGGGGGGCGLPGSAFGAFFNGPAGGGGGLGGGGLGLSLPPPRSDVAVSWLCRQIMTATVETVTEQLDLAPILPAERVVAAVATPVHLTEADLGHSVSLKVCMFSATAKVQVARATLVGEDDAPIEDGDDDDDTDFWHTSVGKFRFSLEELPQQLQFIHQLLKELPNIQQPDIIYHSLRCLHALTLHGDALTIAAKDHRGFVIWCQENLLIKNLWELSNAEHSHMSAVSVPVLLHCITLPCGTDVFWRVIQDEFHSHDWRVRFIAVERVTMIARFMDSTPLRIAYDLQGALANAFCYLISSMDDSDVLVAQRATLYLGTIHDTAIRALIHCLETQFDSVIVDRPMVLQSLYQLHNCLSDRKILTWDFFLNRFDTLFLEAQISLEKSGDITYLRDLRNTDMNSEIFVRKLHRAHEALSQSQQSDGSTSSGVKTLSASFGPKWPYKRTMSAPATMAPRQESKQDGHIHSLNAGVGGGEEMVGFLHRVIDLEESDRETMHLLVFLLMQFLSRADQAYPTDEKHIAKAQGIVLRHLYLLLGYNHNEKGFHIPPQRLRMSPVFNVFLANLPQFLDQNHEMAWSLVPTALVVLQYCPCPHQGANIVQHQQPDYSLWFLEPHSRRSWLMSIIVLLYKYQYNQQPYSTQIQALVRIVLNTLDTQHHKCKRLPTSIVMGTGTSRSRDVSQPSLGGEPDHERFETPPLSPLCSVDGAAGSGSGAGTSGGTKGKGTYGVKSPGVTMATHWEESVRPPSSGTKHLHKVPPESSYSIEADDTESELAAIPESPKSDSTLHGSVPGSFDEFAPIDETCCALTEETSAKPTRPVIVEPPERPVTKAKLEITKPFWFLGTEESNNEKKVSAISWKWKLGSNESRCGLKEGVKMMVASPLLSISQPQVQKSVVVSQNNTISVSTTVSNTIPSGNCSVPGPSMFPIAMPMPTTPRPFGNVGTSFFGGMQSLATAALGLEPPRPIPAPTNGNEATTGGMNEKCDEKTRSLERWPDNPEHGSPIPRPLGRQKRVSEPAVSVAGVAASSATGGGPSWQIDLNKINQQAVPPNLITTPITHLPWQLDLHSQISKSTPPSSISFSHLRDNMEKTTNGGSATIYHIPIMAPAVERLLPIGNNRSVVRNIPHVKSEEYYGSPESPLSKMDLMTVGSPIELDSENNENNDNNLSSDVTSTCSASQLEPPPQERLLPIGQQSSSIPPQGHRGGPDQLNGLVERVKLALGLPSPTFESSQPITVPQPSQIPSRMNNDHGLVVGGYSRQDSSDKPSDSSISPAHPRDDSNYPSRGVSPRRLIKQLALDSSPPQLNDSDEQPSPFYRSVHYDRKPQQARPEEQLRNSQQRRVRKVGLLNVGPPSMNDFGRRPGSWYGSPQPLLDPATQAACHAEFDLKQSSFRIGDDCVYQRCSECGLIKEEYSDEELGLCIIILATFIHREPALAAPLLPEMLSVVATVALNATYPWQSEANIHLPGGASSVAHQFLRCVLHQLAPNGIFVQMFQTKIDDSMRMQFFRSVAQALLDFNELNPIAPLQLLLEGLNSKKSLSTEHLGVVLHNMACYLDCLPLEVGLGPGSSTWSALLSQLEILFRRVVLLLNSVEDINPLIRIMVSVLKVPGIAGFRGMLDPFGKVISFAIQNFTIKYHYLVDLCYLCNRAFTREREKLFLSRMVVIELVQALKFKTSLPDSNFLMLINFILQDVGGALPLNIVMEDQISLGHEGGPIFTTNASECMKQHINDAVEFLADFHTISKVKSYCKGLTVGLNEDTLGGVLKSGMAQYLALEISRGSSRDNRTVSRYFPWLYNAPSILQQGPREFIDCVGHIRLLSWLLLGSLTHTAHHGTPSTHHTHPQSPCTPVPQEASCHIADHIQVILAGFAEQSKASVLHMSSLSHAFILCQLWTVYLEHTATNNSPNSDAHSITLQILFEFWGKVTPCILTLVSNSKVLSEMVNLHFLSLLEALHESNSMILGKLLPLWSPVLYSHHIQLPGHLQVRLQNCRNAPPWNIPAPNNLSSKNHSPNTNLILLKWLQRLQFKMGQIELQSSAATQFYSV